MSEPSRRPRVLFVSPVSPLSNRSGAEQRSHLLWQALQAHADCDLLQLEEAAGDTRPAVLRQPPSTESTDAPAVMVKALLRAHRWPWRRLKPQPDWTRRIEAALQRPLAGYDLIVGRYLWPVSQLQVPPRARVAVDLDDWRYRRDAMAPAAGLAKLARKWFANALARRELHRFAAAFAVSDLDVRELQGRIPVQWLPNVPAHVPERVGPVPTSSQQLLFVGSLWYAPNVEAVDWLLQQVWPRVRAEMPQATLLLAGTAPQRARDAWSVHPGVSAPGFVDDLAATYAQSCGVVVPVLSGGGSNIKVLEAMAHGRPCVVTPLVHAAFADHLDAGRHYDVAATATEFAAAMVRMLRQPQAQQAMADAARRRVVEVFEPRRFGEAVLEMLRAACASDHYTSR
jgi:glycosyltransferase involved in cell wall biosynthesis